MEEPIILDAGAGVAVIVELIAAYMGLLSIGIVWAYLDLRRSSKNLELAVDDKFRETDEKLLDHHALIAQNTTNVINIKDRLREIKDDTGELTKFLLNKNE